MVKVTIRVKEEVTYFQTKEITQEQYDELIKLNGDDVSEHDKNYYKIDEVIDKQDIFETGGEFLDFEIWEGE